MKSEPPKRSREIMSNIVYEKHGISVSIYIGPESKDNPRTERRRVQVTTHFNYSDISLADARWMCHEILAALPVPKGQ